MLQTLNFAAGGRQINAKASFFRYESGNAGGADESIRVRADGNDLGLYFPGDSIELPIQASGWEINPVNSNTTGVVRLGVGRVQSARLVGTVSVVDTSKQTTQAGFAFFGKSDAAPAATFFGAVQLWNPAGSGRVLILESLLLTNAATPQNLVAGLSPNQAPTMGGVGVSKNSGGIGSVGQIKTDVSLAAIGTSYFNLGTWISAFSSYLGTNGNISRDLKRPVVIKPGFGFAVIGTVANATHGCAFDWYEEAL